jgi:hypothetical protein
MFWGDRCASVTDPWGHLWTLGMKHEQPHDTPEMQANTKEWYAGYVGL